MLLVYFVFLKLEKLWELGTLELEGIFEISDQIHESDKDFIDVDAKFVHSGHFWSAQNEFFELM